MRSRRRAAPLPESACPSKLARLKRTPTTPASARPRSVASDSLPSMTAMAAIAVGRPRHGVEDGRVVVGVAARLDQDSAPDAVRSEDGGEFFASSRLMRRRPIARSVGEGEARGVDDVKMAVGEAQRGRHLILRARWQRSRRSAEGPSWSAGRRDAWPPRRRTASPLRHADAPCCARHARCIPRSGRAAESISSVSAPSGSTAVILAIRPAGDAQPAWVAVS